MENQDNKPKKFLLPPNMVLPGMLQTGDGWVWRRLDDGAVEVAVIRTVDGGIQSRTTLTPEEFDAVVDLVRPGVDAATKAQIDALQAELAAAKTSLPPVAVEDPFPPQKGL